MNRSPMGGFRHNANKEIFLHRIQLLDENIKQTLYKTDIQLI